MTKPFVLSLLSIALLLAGCSTQEPYQRPSLDVPEHFKEAAKLADASGIWQPARTGANGASPVDVPAEWWKLYGDATLDGLQSEAQAGNQTLAQAAARVRAAQAAVASSRASLFPTIGTTGSGSRAKSSGGNYTDSSTGQTTSRSGSINNNFSLGLNASWEVDLWGRVAGMVSADEATAQARGYDLAAARLSMQASVAQTYFSLRAAEAQQRLLKETLDAYTQSWELTRNRYRSGVASSADVAQAESQYKSTEAQLIESQSTRAQLEHALAALLGKAPAAFSLSETGVLPTPPMVPAMLPSKLLEQRPDIAAAERSVAAANTEIGVARAAYFPSLTLSAATGFRGSTLSNLLSAPNLFWSLGPALALSIFDGGARSAAVESSRAQLDLAAATYRQTVITALQEVEDNLVMADALTRELQVQTEAAAAARKALTVANNQYKAGIVTYLNVLSAQTTVLSAERSLIDVQNRRLAAVNTLLKNVAGSFEEPVVR
ncbi:efflux transporter outer membrane subunit [Diaphorobacter aerolatus]|uniref:Efflux transporter outer membrane subunit n=1 Tax=Diaphorobacter aerolatus TaxID=1288495 RepID=A0A7H0GIJ8_9BURK|nr:efflux transporter outer membrane subunit [Diaphorobacter aerolatus]QNP48114.1 efflux transporter outer membrane subunit [Diaphorobacter aerolatus]